MGHVREQTMERVTSPRHSVNFSDHVLDVHKAMLRPQDTSSWALLCRAATCTCRTPEMVSHTLETTVANYSAITESSHGNECCSHDDTGVLFVSKFCKKLFQVI